MALPYANGRIQMVKYNKEFKPETRKNYRSAIENQNNTLSTLALHDLHHPKLHLHQFHPHKKLGQMALFQC